MAKILYGIHGTGHGHAMRGLTIARRLSGHEFLFVANDDALRVLEPEFPVRKIPNLGTVFRNYQVDVAASIKKALPILWSRNVYTKEIIKIIEDFKPDVCMVDLEYFVPRAAEIVGLPCLTLDHQHIITCCKHELPVDLWFDYFLQGLTPRYLFRPTRQNLIISFYSPQVLPQYRARVAPPILRDMVIAAKPRDDGHVLVYQSNSIHRGLVDFLKMSTDRPCYLYGYDRTDGVDGNVHFMSKSEEGFLRHLEGCAYVILGGGHTLMTESLHLGKPILTLPLKSMVEQRFNALYIEKLGYGMQADMFGLKPEILKEFEKRLPEFKKNIGVGGFCGNELVFGLVDDFAKTGTMPGLALHADGAN